MCLQKCHGVCFSGGFNTSSLEISDICAEPTVQMPDCDLLDNCLNFVSTPKLDAGSISGVNISVRLL